MPFFAVTNVDVLGGEASALTASAGNGLVYCVKKKQLIMMMIYMNSMHKLESGAVAVEHARPSSALDTLDFNSTGYISEMLLGTCEVLNYQLRLTPDLKKKKKKKLF